MASPSGTRTGLLTPSGGSAKMASEASVTRPMPSTGSPRRSGPASRTVSPRRRASAPKSDAISSARWASWARSRWAFSCPSAARVARRVGVTSFRSFREPGTTSNTLRTW